MGSTEPRYSATPVLLASDPKRFEIEVQHKRLAIAFFKRDMATACKIQPAKPEGYSQSYVFPVALQMTYTFPLKHALG